MNDALDRARSLLSFSSDLERHLDTSSHTGVTGLVAKFQELRGALDQIDPLELRTAHRDIAGVIASLSGAASELDQLLSLKGAMTAKNQLPGVAP